MLMNSYSNIDFDDHGYIMAANFKGDYLSSSEEDLQDQASELRREEEDVDTSSCSEG